MVQFEFKGQEYSNGFDIILKFEMNNLKINFSADLNNIDVKKIKKFKSKFDKSKKDCCLDFVSSKKNSASICFKSATKKLSFITDNEGYIFYDIDDNYNSVDIELEINEEEKNNFSEVLEDLIDHKYYSEESDECYFDYIEENKEENKEEKKEEKILP